MPCWYSHSLISPFAGVSFTALDMAAQELEVLVLEGDGFGVHHSFVAQFGQLCFSASFCAARSLVSASRAALSAVSLKMWIMDCPAMVSFGSKGEYVAS